MGQGEILKAAVLFFSGGVVSPAHAGCNADDGGGHVSPPPPAGDRLKVFGALGEKRKIRFRRPLDSGVSPARSGNAPYRHSRMTGKRKMDFAFQIHDNRLVAALPLPRPDAGTHGEI